MDRIAELAGVTRAVLYDHFASKKALFLAVLEEQNQFFLGHIAASIRSEGSAEERMRATMDAVFSYAERNPQSWKLLFGNATHGNDAIDAAWRHTTLTRTTAVAMLLAPDALQIGIDPSSERAQIIVEMLIAALKGAVEWRQEHPSTPRSALVDAGADLLWIGLGQPR
jgi:AcrR family transcriptional regulator